MPYFPWFSGATPGNLRPGTNRGIEDARRILCVQEAYDFHHFIRDQVVHHPSANPVPFQTQLRLWDAYLLEGPDLFVAMAITIVWVYRGTSHHFRFPNFETALSILSSFFVPEDDDALLSWVEQILGDKKLRSQIAQ
ncbi:hypothetical protein M405DRAFT_868095 [Rhizopogon salebrosus TDB-379]|nr:hypothetical protein M405DRAFT_868095 [Rhizopogon salebrosus TDB-379]